jgi:hypothetical protein
MMPIEEAHSLANNPRVRDEELEAATAFLTMKIRDAGNKGRPIPFLAYRSKVIFEMAYEIRHPSGWELQNPGRG